MTSRTGPSAREQALLEAVLATPGDATPRLAYAEYLQQQHDPRGDFIALDCQLDGLADDDPRRPAIAATREQLLARHGTAWTREIEALKPPGTTKRHVSFPQFRRGFVEHVGITSHALLACGDRLFSLAPIRSLFIAWWRKDDRDSLPACALLRRLEALNVANAPTAPAFAKLAASPHLAGVRRLWLQSDCRIGDAGAAALASSPALAGLEELGLRANGVGDAGALALVRSPRLPQLRHLNLEQSRLSVEGWNAVFADPGIARLRRLELGSNELTDAVAAAITKASFGGLTHLDVAHTRIGSAVAVALASSPNLASLEELYVGVNPIDDDGVAAILGSRNLGRLRLLSLSLGPGADRLLATLSDTKRLPSLRRLESTDGVPGPASRDLLRRRGVTVA
jgi:uncharacterized protein (TIGR02996 family)